VWRTPSGAILVGLDIKPRRNDEMTSATADIHDNSLAGARAWFAQHRLTRPREGFRLTGVTAGLARRFGLNVLVARVAMVVGVVVLTPLLYVPLWVLMPKDAPSGTGSAPPPA
jgi:phage shock protein PspC (stress-responsive transcriptional regulator)